MSDDLPETVEEWFKQAKLQLPACSRPLEITYSVAPDGNSITFQPCGVTTNNRHDIENRYCPLCHRFMELIEVAREMSKPGYWESKNEDPT